MSNIPDEREIFSLTGPTFLTAVDWNNSHHRRSVAASLVKGVYTLERDRRYNRQGPHALAPPWWQFFHFRPVKILIDNHDTSYFGVVYEFVPPPHDPRPRHNYFGGQRRAPQYVVAFRGTINMPGNRKQDFKLNLHVIINNLQRSTRFQIGLESVCDVLQRVGPENVWLAGHSLGSSIALVLGREMVKQTRVHLETYLFNPPFASPPIGRITNDKLKIGLRFVNSVLTAGLALALNKGGGRRGSGNNAAEQESDPFTVLSSWVPYLFVNPLDPICSEYAGYFKHREYMESIGAGKIAKIATKHSIGSILSGVTKRKESEALHLIPSAYLTINSSRLQSFKEAHGIQQWWRPDLQFEYKSYQYK